MAEFISNYKSLSFYVGDELKSFSNGQYVTTNQKEIEALLKLVDAVRVDKEQPKAEESKVAPKKKASAK
jgi:hypothetical protein